jgi:hypothetical protein
MTLSVCSSAKAIASAPTVMSERIVSLVFMDVRQFRFVGAN